MRKAIGLMAVFPGGGGGETTSDLEPQGGMKSF